MFVLRCSYWIIKHGALLVLALLPSVFYGAILLKLGILFHDLTGHGSVYYIRWYAFLSLLLWLWFDRKRIYSLIINTYIMLNKKMVLQFLTLYWAAKKKVLADEIVLDLVKYAESLLKYGASKDVFVKEIGTALGVDLVKEGSKISAIYDQNAHVSDFSKTLTSSSEGMDGAIREGKDLPEEKEASDLASKSN